MSLRVTSYSTKYVVTVLHVTVYSTEYVDFGLPKCTNPIGYLILSLPKCTDPIGYLIFSLPKCTDSIGYLIFSLPKWAYSIESWVFSLFTCTYQRKYEEVGDLSPRIQQNNMLCDSLTPHPCVKKSCIYLTMPINCNIQRHKTPQLLSRKRICKS